MELWVVITIGAAFIQNIRFMLQKHLKQQLSTGGATFARFIWAAPLAVVLVFLLHLFGGKSVPPINASFIGYSVLGGVTQILATALLVFLFGMRNFAVGVTFSKTETVQSVLFGLVLLGEFVSGWSFVAILISFLGVVLISVSPDKLNMAGFLSKSTMVGLASGALFGVAAVSYRAASLSLESGDFLMRASVTLAFVTIVQTVLMVFYLASREPGEIARVVRGWRLTALVGITGMLGSLGWFTAMTLQNAAYVRAVGQIELIFTFAASYLFFKERSSPREIIGVLLVGLGIIGLVLWG